MSSEDSRPSLTGAEKCAAFMLALNEESSMKIWEQLDEDEVLMISAAMARIGSVSSQELERIFIEFARQIGNRTSVSGSYQTAKRLLARGGMPADRLESLMDEIQSPVNRSLWDKLTLVDVELLASFLRNEYPQTAAVVLSRLKADHAARVFQALPEEFAIEIIMRILTMDVVQRDVLDRVEQILRIEFMANLARTQTRDSHEAVAEVFNYFDRATEGRFIAALDERVKESAEKIRSLMFTFEDLSKLDSSGIQTLLKSIDKARLALALKGGSEKIRDLFFSAMSERASKILREEMQQMGPVRLRDVEEAQGSIVNMAKDLASRNEIVLVSGNDARDELIY